MGMLLIAGLSAAMVAALYDVSAKVCLVSVSEDGTRAEVRSHSLFRRGKTVSMRLADGEWVHAASGRKPLFGLGRRIDGLVRRRQRCKMLREHSQQRSNCGVSKRVLPA